MINARNRKPIAARVAKSSPAGRHAVRTTGCQICLGVLVGWDEKGPLIEFEGARHSPARARVAGPSPVARPTGPARPGQEVVLLIDPRPGRAPVLLGFLQPLESTATPPAADVEARIDGRRVELDARDEIVLRCGEASITLRRNGRVVIRGIQVETRATGLNRIKGGSVAIN